MNKAHEEMRSVFEQREHDVSKEWEEKLQALHNDHQAAVKYLRGTEKMLSKMKQELDRYKNANSKLEEELSQAKQRVSRSPTKEQTSELEAEREALRAELSTHQASMKSTVAQFEAQLITLQTELASARQNHEYAVKNAQTAERTVEQSRGEIETLRHENALIEERAKAAETRVQMFLDQFETSVDNYRRQSQVPPSAMNGAQIGHRQHDSIASGDSMYSDNDAASNPEVAKDSNSGATRNSMALDNLASELDALRSHWETTNKAYRLSDRFDFEQTPTNEKNELSESLAQWRQRMDIEDEDDDGDEKMEKKAVQPHPSATSTTASHGGSTMI
jgi:hypothetical protein